MGDSAGRLDVQSVDYAAGQGLFGKFDQAGTQRFAQVAQCNVLPHGQLIKQAQPLAVFGNECHARRKSIGGMTEPDRSAIHEKLASGRHAAGAIQAFEKFGASRAHQSGDPQHFAGVNRQIDIAQPMLLCMTGPGQRDIPGLEYGRPRLARLKMTGPFSDAFNLAPHHQMGDGAGDDSAGSTVVTTRPSRRTVIRSASRKTSSIL